MCECRFRYLADHEIGDPGRHRREGGSLCSNGGVHDFYRAFGQTQNSGSEKGSSLDPRKRTNTSGEEDVVDVNTGHESDTLGSSAVSLLELLSNIGSPDEHRASDDIPADQGDSTTNFVEEKNTSNLTHNSHGVIDTVDQQGAILETHSLIDCGRVVLDCRNASHLDTELEDDTIEDLSKIGFVLENLALSARRNFRL